MPICQRFREDIGSAIRRRASLILKILNAKILKFFR
jgi:hypothetical protein